MRLRLELTLGPLYLLFDPNPETEDDEPAESTVAYTQAERGDDVCIPELHVGFRGGQYD